MPNLTINGQSYFADAPPDTPLLWVIREDLRLTGTKYGCGIGMCGSCTVHVDGQAVRSCSVPVGSVEGKLITTIEGLDSSNAHPVQQAWIECATRDKILWAKPEEPLLGLLERLLAADVNQMPVVTGSENDGAHIIGMVTRDSILRVMQARAEVGTLTPAR